jgi:isocitrate dehydrogenase
MSDTPITVAYGDGIGPEIMSSVLAILEAAGAPLDIETVDIGEKVYASGNSAGITDEAWASLRRTRVFLKSPITTPTGGGVKSLNVTVRKTLSLFANVRPVRSLHPFVDTKHPDMDVVVVRENEEDLYAGIEHRQTREVTQCLKLLTYPGSERIARYAFEYARATNRKKVTCFVKDNIMKVTDGTFYKVFAKVAEEYPDIESDRMIIDIATARLADTPEWFDVIVAPNLYGDIISDVAAQIAGSVGLAGSANIGEHCAMFEAVHGSAPDIAGQGIANPSGLLQGAIQMLVHIGQPDVATAIQNAFLRTIEDGIHTGDIYTDGHSKVRANTETFTKAIIERLGQEPQALRSARYDHEIPVPPAPPPPAQQKELIGVDVFLDWDEDGRDPDVVGNKLIAAAEGNPMDLIMITNRGVKVFPDGKPETFSTDHWRCRFQRPDEGAVTRKDIIDLLTRIDAADLDFIKMEQLYTFDGEPGFSLGQGQ